MKISIDKLYCIRKTCYSRIYIIKDNYFAEKLIQEYKTLKFLRDNKFKNIPEFELKNIGHRYFLILTNIKTDPMFWDKINKDQTSKIIKCVKKLHRIKNRKGKKLKHFFNQEINRTRLNLNRYTIINMYDKTEKFKHFYNLLLKHIDYIEERSKKIFSGRERCSFIHKGLSYSHILYSNGEIKIIDWEDSSFGDPASDLSQLFNEPRFPKRVFLNQYSTLKENKIIMKRIKFYRYLNFINEILQLLSDNINLEYDLNSLQKVKEIFYEKEILLNLRNLKKIRKTL